jgi:hypothetical protein
LCVTGWPKETVMEAMVDVGSRREERADRKLLCAGDFLKFV